MRIRESALREAIRSVISESSAYTIASKILSEDPACRRLVQTIVRLKSDLEQRVKREHPVTHDIFDLARGYLEEKQNEDLNLYDVLRSELNYRYRSYDGEILSNYREEINKILMLVRALLTSLTRKMDAADADAPDRTFYEETFSVPHHDLSLFVSRYPDSLIWADIKDYFDLYEIPDDPELRSIMGDITSRNFSTDEKSVGMMVASVISNIGLFGKQILDV